MFENLDIVQVILIGIGLVIVASIFLKSSEDSKPAPKPTPPPIVPVDVHEKDHGHDFMCLVQKWYDLKACGIIKGMTTFRFAANRESQEDASVSPPARTKYWRRSQAVTEVRHFHFQV